MYRDIEIVIKEIRRHQFKCFLQDNCLKDKLIKNVTFILSPIKGLYQGYHVVVLSIAIVPPLHTPPVA